MTAHLVGHWSGARVGCVLGGGLVIRNLLLVDGPICHQGCKLCSHSVLTGETFIQGRFNVIIIHASWQYFTDSIWEECRNLLRTYICAQIAILGFE